jgi:hypothetical protein
MTLGQLNMHKWLASFSTDDGVPAYGMQFWRLRPGPGVTLADVTETMAVLLARHEGLRTRYLDGHRQQVVASGELPLHVLPVDDGTDPALVDATLDAIAAAQPYDPRTQLPVCVAVAIREDQVLAGVVRCSHLAADHKAMIILGGEIERMLDDPAARLVGPPRHQPIDQAEVEQGRAVRRRADAALGYWTERLYRMPANPLANRSGQRVEESRAMEMASHVGAAALSRIEARTSLDRSTIVLAAVLSVLSQRTGYATNTFCALSGNRFFGRRLADYVGTLATSSLVEIDRARASFDELGERVRAGLLSASLNALYDVYRLHAIAERIERERGIAFHYFPPIFNNAAHYFHPRPGRSTAPATTAPTEFTWRPMPPTPAPLRFDLWRADEVLVLDAWTGNTDRVSRSDMRSMLLAVERLLVAASAHDLDQRRIDAIIDLPVIARNEGWLFLDSCWVRLAEVQSLLDKALSPGRGRVFGEADGQPLVAYVAATDSIHTPERAHARCMSRISDYPAAMTPRHYVLCDRAPDHPQDLAAWREQVVLASGPGRDLDPTPGIARPTLALID